MPASDAGAASSSSTGGWFREFWSRASGPAMSAYARAQSRTDAAIGPTCATLQQSGAAPNSLTRPNVALMPTRPQNAEGMRIDPPPSAPIATGTRPEATAVAGPLDEPPV